MEDQGLYLAHYGVKGMKWGKRKARENTRKDSFVLKKGTEIHRVTGNDKEQNKGHAFSSFKRKDVVGYASRSRWLTKNKTFDLTMRAKEDLLLPSKRERVSTFVSLMMTDKKFVDAYTTQKNSYLIIKKPKEEARVKETIREAEREYSLFTAALGGSKPLRDRYFSELKKKGYNAIIDDADASVVSNSPIIVFNRGKSLEVVRVNEITKDYLKTLKRQQRR